MEESMEGFSEYTKSALEILRHPSLTMKWYVVPLFVMVLYIAAKEIHEKNYKAVLAGFALWGVDIFNEIWNSMICFSSGFAPVWGTPAGVGGTAWLLMIGYNVEISMMFFIMGIMACHNLPDDPKKKIFGINNRIVVACILTTAAVIVECFLNYCGLLTWEWSFWQRSCPWVLWIIGYLPFFSAAFLVYDQKEIKNSIKIVAGILGFDVILIAVCAAIGLI